MQISGLLTDDAVLIEIGARLATTRAARGLSPEALAAEAGIPATTVAQAECGEAIALPDLLRLLRALDGLEALDRLLAPAPAARPADSAPAHHPAGTGSAPPEPEPQTGFVMRDNRGRQRAGGRRPRSSIDRRASGGPKPPGRFIWGDDPPPADA